MLWALEPTSRMSHSGFPLRALASCLSLTHERWNMHTESHLRMSQNRYENQIHYKNPIIPAHYVWWEAPIQEHPRI